MTPFRSVPEDKTIPVNPINKLAKNVLHLIKLFVFSFSISSAYTPAACTRRPAASSAYDMRIGSPYFNTTNAAMFGMGSHSHPHNMYNNELLAAQNRLVNDKQARSSSGGREVLPPLE